MNLSKKFMIGIDEIVRSVARNIASRLWVIVLMCCMIFSAVAKAESAIKICMDESDWYPFTIVKNGKGVGIHIDIIKEALSNLGYTYTFRIMPWKRCLNEAKQGHFDAVATASFNQSRAEFLDYPKGAAKEHKSSYRVMQVEYVVVTLRDDSYKFDGDIKTIPRPIRAPRGYSIVGDLEKQGLVVDDNSANDEINIKKLLREGRGSVVVIPEMVRMLSQQLAYKNKLTISEIPWKSKSYFLPFSKLSHLSDSAKTLIWSEIKKTREDALFMSQSAEKY